MRKEKIIENVFVKGKKIFVSKKKDFQTKFRDALSVLAFCLDFIFTFLYEYIYTDTIWNLSRSARIIFNAEREINSHPQMEYFYWVKNSGRRPIAKING